MHFVLLYLVWREATGCHKSTILNFFHGRWFGLLKQAFRKSRVSSLECMESVDKWCSSSYQAQLVGKVDGTPIVHVANWQEHLNPIGHLFNGINSNQQF